MLQLHTHYFVLLFLFGTTTKQFPGIKNETEQDWGEICQEICQEVQLSVPKQCWPNKLTFLPARSLTSAEIHTAPHAGAPGRTACPSADACFLSPSITSTTTQPKKQNSPNASPCIKGNVIYCTGNHPILATWHGYPCKKKENNNQEPSYATPPLNDNLNEERNLTSHST